MKVIRWMWRHKWLTLVLGLVVGFAPTVWIVVLRVHASHPDVWPSVLPGEVVAEEQTETFTCGWHAMRSIYRAHGLDPDRERLRERLGVDYKAVFWDSSSRGTFHTEIFLLFEQDHFGVRALDLSWPGAADEMVLHLEGGWLAMLLIARPENGAMHWVVVDEVREGEIRVVDSLTVDPYWVEAEGYVSGHVLSVLLVRPRELGDGKTAGKAQARGAAEMVRAMDRLAALGGSGE